MLMEKIETMVERDQFLDEQRKKIEKIINQKKAEITRLEDNTKSEEVVDKTKVDSFNTIGKLEGDIRGLEKTLKKIDDGGYGICTRCHGQIPIGRLKAMPTASTCVKCPSQTNKN